METNNIIGNLNLVFEKIFGSVEKEVFNAIDDILVITKDVFEKEPLNKFISVDGTNYIEIIANSLITMYAIYFIVINFIAMYNGNTKRSVYKFIIKLVIIGILANSSRYLCTTILEINCGFTYAIDTLGQIVTGGNIDFVTLKDKIINIDEFIKEDSLSLNGIIKGMLSFGSVSVLMTFAIRYVTIIILLLIAPLAIICISSDLTSGIFVTYLKILIINLMMQNITKIIILVPLTCTNTTNFMYKIIMVGSIYSIYKVNIFTKEIFSKITSGNLERGE